jgi:hypothetical protein
VSRGEKGAGRFWVELPPPFCKGVRNSKHGDYLFAFFARACKERFGERGA